MYPIGAVLEFDMYEMIFDSVMKFSVELWRFPIENHCLLAVDSIAIQNYRTSQEGEGWSVKQLLAYYKVCHFSLEN